MVYQTDLINRLPAELLAEIFLCLPWADHLSLMAVCQRWHSLLLTEPSIGGRYYTVPYNFKRPQIHGIFSDIGLECRVVDGKLVEATFVLNEREGGLWTEDEREQATISILHHPLLDDKLIRFLGREKEQQEQREWRMGLLTLWGLRGLGLNNRQMQWRDNISFVKNEDGSMDNDLTNGFADVDITVREFMEAVGRYAMKHEWVKLKGDDLRLRLGMYNTFDMVVIRNILEPLADMTL